MESHIYADLELHFQVHDCKAATVAKLAKYPLGVQKIAFDSQFRKIPDRWIRGLGVGVGEGEGVVWSSKVERWPWARCTHVVNLARFLHLRPLVKVISMGNRKTEINYKRNKL